MFMEQQIEKLENRIKKNKWHIARLEQIIKLLDNDDLDPTKLDNIKDDVEYYIEVLMLYWSQFFV
jgi:CCR4-NOT transcription complex subunit 3